MKRSIDLLSVKFVEAGLVTDGGTYTTPKELIPLSALLVQDSSNNGPILQSATPAQQIPTEGISVNFVARRLEGTFALDENQLQKVQNALNKILKLHDELRAGAVVKLATGFVLE